MIYGEISILIVLLGLCGGLFFLVSRTWNLSDALRRDYTRLSQLADCQQLVIDKLSINMRDLETENYTKLAARIAAHGGELEEISARVKSLSASVDQVSKKFASWDRVERKSAAVVPDVDRAPLPDGSADPGHAAIQRAIAEGLAIPLSTSSAPNGRKPGLSIRSRVPH